MNDIDSQILQGLHQLLQAVQDPQAQQLVQHLIQLQTQEIQQEQGQANQQAPQGQGAPSHADLLQALAQRR